MNEAGSSGFLRKQKPRPLHWVIATLKNAVWNLLNSFVRHFFFMMNKFIAPTTDRGAEFKNKK